MIRDNQDYLLFDGDCGVCTWSAQLARRLDKKQRFVVEPYQSFSETELRNFGISYENCSKELKVIARRGHVHGGAFGVNYFLWHQTPWRPVVIFIYALPLILLLEVIGYKLIAANRHRISAWLGMTACAIQR